MSSIQLKRGTKTEWAKCQSYSSTGRVRRELTTNKFKVGNGVSRWNDLPYTDKKLVDEVDRLKTYIDSQPTEVYTYRGTTLPTLPTDAKKAYYLTFYSHLQLLMLL